MMRPVRTHPLHQTCQRHLIIEIASAEQAGTYELVRPLHQQYNAPLETCFWRAVLNTFHIRRLLNPIRRLWKGPETAVLSMRLRSL